MPDLSFKTSCPTLSKSRSQTVRMLIQVVVGVIVNCRD